jgi:hypothetical protein
MPRPSELVVKKPPGIEPSGKLPEWTPAAAFPRHFLRAGTFGGCRKGSLHLQVAPNTREATQDFRAVSRRTQLMNATSSEPPSVLLREKGCGLNLGRMRGAWVPRLANQRRVGAF